MILEAAVINLTRNLDLLCRKNSQSISSHDKLKEEGLDCLLNILEKAPLSEYQNFLSSKDHNILIGYTLSVLCELAKKDKSKPVKLRSLNTISFICEKLEYLHSLEEPTGGCVAKLILSALPGVSSTLFRLIMSDTKLPRSLFAAAIKCLTNLINVAFLPCEHNSDCTDSPYLNKSDLSETCHNLGIRMSVMIDYILVRSNELPSELMDGVLYLCHTIVSRTQNDLLRRTLNSIVQFTAFFSSNIESARDHNAELKLTIMLISDNIRQKVQSSSDHGDDLESVVIKYLFSLLDHLDEDSPSSLAGRRQSEISLLCGYLRLLPSENLTNFLEIVDRREQLIKVLTRLAEFETQQPFLLITGVQIDDKALEICDERVYTVVKRFLHLGAKEIELLCSCCQVIGELTSWPLLKDLFRSILCSNPGPNDLFITHQILLGCLARKETSKVGLFTREMIEQYLGHINEIYICSIEPDSIESRTYSQDIVTIVIAIETLVTLVDLYIRSTRSDAERVIILKILLCPLLNWSSSTSRAISEASLSALAQISRLYNLDSTISLIMSNIDYIVDGVSKMLDNFSYQTEVTNVLAIAFKLSSMDSFFYFKDVFEKIFKLLGKYHHTEKSKSIALLFYRTLNILSHRKEAQEGKKTSEVPLRTEASIKTVIRDIDIEGRLVELQRAKSKADSIRASIERLESSASEHEQIISDVESGKLPEIPTVHQDPPDEPKKEKSTEILFTERILHHCVGLISSDSNETKVLALKAATIGFNILSDDEDTLLPLVHLLWTPLINRLTSDYRDNMELNLCAFECLIAMAQHAKDFIKRRTLDSIIPRLCLFLDSQANLSKRQKEHGPYCMTIAFKCQLKILMHLGALAYNIQLAYRSLWRVVRTTLIYLDSSQVPSLREAARASLHYMIALDADCVWYFAKQSGHLQELPFELIYM